MAILSAAYLLTQGAKLELVMPFPAGAEVPDGVGLAHEHPLKAPAACSGSVRHLFQALNLRTHAQISRK